MVKYDLTELREKIKYNIRTNLDIEDLIGMPVLFVQPQNDPRAASYIKSKQNILKEVGLTPLTIEIPEDGNEEWLEDLIHTASCVNLPILVQLPLPKHIPESVVKGIPANIDVDRLGYEALAEQNDGHGYKYLKPCTVSGILDIIDDYRITLIQTWGCKDRDYKLSGVTITVIGRGSLVGRPLTRVLQDKGATVICCNSKTDRNDLRTYINMSDIVVSAAGKHGVISADMITDNYKRLLIIDAGIEFINGKLHGDFAYDKDTKEDVLPYVKYTPHIGGVGPMTVLSVAYNAGRLWTEAAEDNDGFESFYADGVIELLKEKGYDVNE